MDNGTRNTDYALMILLKKVAIAAVTFIFIVSGIWLVVVPEGLIVDLMEDSLNRHDLYLRAEGLKKGLFYSFRVERVSLNRRDINNGKGVPKKSQDFLGYSDEPLLTFNDVDASVDLLSLLRLSPVINLRCTLNGGRVSGRFRVMGRANFIRIYGDGIKIGGIPFLKRIGINGEGSLSGNFWYSNREGEAKFSATGARFENLFYRGVSLPLSLFHDIRGVIVINGETINLKSFTLNGNGVYARLRGNIKGSDLDINIELMTDSSLKQGPILEWMLRTYRVSPGYYVIPVRGPLLQG